MKYLKHLRLFTILVSLIISLSAYPSSKMIFINKTDMMLYVINNEDTVAKYPICLGKNYGQKKRAGDHKTPEGTFSISMIQNSSSWTHDFKDGKGRRKGAYGPWFFRLKTPMSRHIGIHGTCFPESIGTRQSEGCIRLHNKDLTELYKHVFIGMKVVISPD